MGYNNLCDVDPRLKPDRFRFWFELIKEIYQGCVDSHEPDKGDTGWGNGTKKRDRLIEIFERNSRIIDWFECYRYNNNRLGFFAFMDGISFLIDNKGGAKDRNNKFKKIKALYSQKYFDFHSPEVDLYDPSIFGEIYIQEDNDGYAIGIIVCLYDEKEESLGRWENPFDSAISAAHLVKEDKREAANLGKPRGLRKDKNKPEVKQNEQGGKG